METNTHGNNSGITFSDNTVLKSENGVPEYSYFNKIVGSSPLLKNTLNNAKKIAQSDAPVLITGESGTGKELFADYIFSQSRRKNKPYIKINCASIPESLFETELFGHVKGSFTDANYDRKGKFLSADTGTLFLDEIFELPLNVQSRLLRVVESGTMYQIGSENALKTDVRIIAATNRNIREEINKGNFKKELLYRINVLNLEIPPLRYRKEDIRELSDYFIRKTGNNIRIAEEAYNLLLLHDWPGNIRELSNTISRAVVSSESDLISKKDISVTDFTDQKKIILPLKKAVTNFKKEYIIRTLKYNSWNQLKTAEMLGIQRTYLSRLIKELDIVNNKE